MPYLGDVNLTEQYPGIVEHRYETRVALAYDVDKLSERHVRIHRHKILLNHAVKAHERQCRLVCVMGYQFAFFCETHCIDAVRLEYADCHYRAYAYNDKRHEQAVAVCYLGNEENAGERSVHHSCHHSSHAEESEVLLRQMNTYAVDVPQSREKESAESSDEQ